MRGAARSGLHQEGAIVSLDTAPPADSLVVRLDEMDPSAKSFSGHHLVRGDPLGQRRVRARQEIDDGRRGRDDILRQRAGLGIGSRANPDYS